VKKHAQEQWMVLYIERGLKARVQQEDGQLVPNQKATPQGGVLRARQRRRDSFGNRRLNFYENVPYCQALKTNRASIRTLKSALA
jgi:hypothetical protein